MADPTSDPLGTYAGIINDPLPSGEGPKKALDTLNTTTKEEIKAIAQAANEAEAKARAKANSLSMKIQSTMFRSIAQTDATLAHLNRLLATPSHTDTLLMTTSYTLSLLHAFLTSTTNARLNREAATIIRKLRSTPLLPGETIVATISPSPSSPSYRLQTSSKVLAGLIDDFRMFTRLLSLVKMWAWGASTLRNPNKDGLLKNVVWTQVLACTAFQGFENAAYLATKGIIDLKGETVVRFYRWSARFWAVHVSLEFVRLWRLRELRAKSVEKDETVDAKWWRDLYSNAAWLPMTWHYSVSGGLISDASIAALGLIAGVLGLREAWTGTA